MLGQFILEISMKKGENKSRWIAFKLTFVAERKILMVVGMGESRRGCLLMEVENIENTDIDIVANIEKELRYISGIIKQKGREILSNYTITPPQFLALQWLFEDGDMTIGELSNKMYLACSTTTDLVDRMEKNHLVMRVKDHNDRRVVRIHLLDEGKRIIDEVIKKRQAYLNEVLKNFSNQDIQNLQSNLTKLHHDMR